MREFVQSDWFLPVFISHDRDYAPHAWNVWCNTHAPGWIDPLECRDSLKLKATAQLLYIILVKFGIFKQQKFKNENKGIVFKARWFVRPDINTGATISLLGMMPLSFHLMVAPVFISGRTNHRALIQFFIL